MNAEEMLADLIEIKSINELKQVLIDLHRNFILKGILVELNSLNLTKEILSQIETQSTPDIINLKYTTVPNGVRYFLSCDTFHGNGVFKRLNETGIK